MVHNFQHVLLDTSASTGKLSQCILGHLGLVFIWSCFVSCLLFLSSYVSLRNPCSGTCREIRSPLFLFALNTSPSFTSKRQRTMHLRPSKKKKFLIRISIKKESWRAVFLFIVSYCMLSLHIITFSRVYAGALRSNINKTKHQILIKHKFCENLHYFGVYTAAMGFTSDACWFLLIKTLLIKNNKKEKKWSGRERETFVFFLLGLIFMQ